jgi:hypothetical protein
MKGLAESLGAQYRLCAINEKGAVSLSVVMIRRQKPRVATCEMGGDDFGR